MTILKTPMTNFIEFIDKYFVHIWLVLAITILSIFYVRGRKAIQMFADLDLSKIVYSEKNASGYSLQSYRSKRGGASSVLHIFISDKELIIKTSLLLAYIAEKNDLLHRIPLDNIISTEIKKRTIHSKLFVKFKNSAGEVKTIVLISRNNKQIKEQLDSNLNIRH